MIGERRPAVEQAVIVELATLVARFAALVPQSMQRSRACQDLSQGLLHLLRRLCPSSGDAGPAVLQRLHARRPGGKAMTAWQPDATDQLAETALVRFFSKLYFRDDAAVSATAAVSQLWRRWARHVLQRLHARRPGSKATHGVAAPRI